MIKQLLSNVFVFYWVAPKAKKERAVKEYLFAWQAFFLIMIDIALVTKLVFRL